MHPDLGTLADFRAFVRRAAALGIEIALDLALQASPDHPWVAEHPDWFTQLPDGTIRYAENPPKKYQDIYPVNFDNDPEGIFDEVLRIVRHWIEQGVRIFRVDNPHTKPLTFWERLIAAVNADDPDVVFLAEAFTRPAMMQALAMVGFQQSYSYFTWRNTKQELEEFLTSVSQDTADFLRPNLFVNTPDILTEYLQFGGPAAFTVRATIAATAAPTWGVYSGFELFEYVARPGAEEAIDNEKYEFKPRDFAAAEKEGRSLALYLGILNAHPHRAPGARPAAQHPLPLERRRLRARVLEAPRRAIHARRPRRHGHRRRERRPALGAGDHRAPRPRRHRAHPRHPLRGRGPRDRASLGLGRRQLRAPRRVHEARAHPPRRARHR